MIALYCSNVKALTGLTCSEETYNTATAAAEQSKERNKVIGQAKENRKKVEIGRVLVRFLLFFAE